MRRRVVLYNPRAVFYTMPLALLAIGSRLDPRRFEVCIVDGRLEADPVDAVRQAIDAETVCLGVTVLTGAPIRDALAVSRAVRAARPGLPIIWGGWHPSLFPQRTASDAPVDAVVVGQGEDTFAEIVDRLRDDAHLDGIPGCVLPAGLEDGAQPAAAPGPSRAMRDINEFPRHDYALVPVERYFALKRQRQVDYVSSQGCRFRCSFCADPAVYRRSWSGLTPDRIGEELEAIARHHGATDVNFQDETFFTSASRVAAVADEMLGRGLRLSWAATMRADQGARLAEPLLAECRRAGLRRVMVGVESGSPETLSWMHKDATLEQVFETADKCRRHGIAGIFNLIVGFPDESADSVDRTLAVARRLQSMSPRFEVALFYFRPYPGNPIAEALERNGYRFPEALEEWSTFDYVDAPSPWLDASSQARIEAFKFYQRLGWSPQTLVRAPLQRLARWRCDHDQYAFPVEKRLIEWLRPSTRLS